MAKRVRPINGLPGDPHDQEHYRRSRVPEALAGDVDPGRPGVARLLVHGRSIESIHYL
ncbi:MAG TPA: hypothetical protein VK604_08670 [Bryobacteraceae bacterium]|nr:hypothetical protein [Bryobacteraceae bacterium]